MLAVAACRPGRDLLADTVLEVSSRAKMAVYYVAVPGYVVKHALLDVL